LSVDVSQLRQFLSHLLHARVVSRTVVAAFLVGFLLLALLPVDNADILENDSVISYRANSNDGYSAIEYTDEHTTVSIGPSDRQANLRMPGNHDYSRPLPVVVSLHGYSGNGLSNAAYMHHFDSIHENEHLLIYPDGTSNWLGMRYWNATDACCQNVASATPVDDVSYILGLIDEAILNYGADPDGVVITGLSGSGKSSLAFDTLYAEGQRRYVESLSSYARQFLGRLNKPKVESIKGISPAIAIEQKKISNNPRSTIGTSTEIYDYLKLLFARIGKTYSPISGKIVKRHQINDVVNFITKNKQNQEIVILSKYIGENKNILNTLNEQGFSRIYLNNKIYKIVNKENIIHNNSKKIILNSYKTKDIRRFSVNLPA